MEEEKGKRKHHHGNGNYHMYLLFFSFVAVFFAAVCTAQEEEYSSVSFISSDTTYLLPCVYRGFPFSHGESWMVNECSTCTCANSTIECVILGCQPTTCDKEIHPPGECCPMCPNIVNISDVAPVAKVTSSPKLLSGKKNKMLLNVSITFHETDLTTGVQGEDLWNMTIWTSRQPNGEGFAYSVAKNVLNAEQRSQRHRKGKKFPKLRNIPYTLDARRMNCEEMRYICVRFQQATNPGHANREYVPFYFSGYPTDNALTGCTPAPRCKVNKPKPGTRQTTAAPTTRVPTTTPLPTRPPRRIRPTRRLTTPPAPATRWQTLPATIRPTFPPTKRPTLAPIPATRWPTIPPTRWATLPPNPWRTLPLTRWPTHRPTHPPTLQPTQPPTLPPRTTRKPKLRKTKKPKRLPATEAPTLASVTTQMLNEALAEGSTQATVIPTVIPTVVPTVPATSGFVPTIRRFVPEDSESNEAFESGQVYPIAFQRNAARNRNRHPGRRAERLRSKARMVGMSSDEITQLEAKKMSRRRQNLNRKHQQQQQQPLPYSQNFYRQQQRQQLQQHQQQVQQWPKQQQQPQQYPQQQELQQYQEQQHQYQQYHQQQSQQNRNNPASKVREGQLNPFYKAAQEKAIAEGTLLRPNQAWVQQAPQPQRQTAYNPGYTWPQHNINQPAIDPNDSSHER